MYKMDSFLRETQRLDSFIVRSLYPFLNAPSTRYWFALRYLPVSLRRLVLRPFTFSNGVTIPAGTRISAPTDPIYRDERSYPNPNEFDGFRFAKLRESEGYTMSSRYQSTSTSSEHLTFGLGRHVWWASFCRPVMTSDLTCHYFTISPGRFFAVNEIKIFLAYIIATYDVKFEEGQGLPRMFCIAAQRFPVSANVMFRRRQKWSHPGFDKQSFLPSAVNYVLRFCLYAARTGSYQSDCL